MTVQREASARIGNQRRAAPVRHAARHALVEVPSVRERRRDANRDRYDRSSRRYWEHETFRCECTRPDCELRLPLAVGRHRRLRDRFIVAPSHTDADADTVVGVADKFLIVEENGRAGSSDAQSAWMANAILSVRRDSARRTEIGSGRNRGESTDVRRRRGEGETQVP